MKTAAEIILGAARRSSGLDSALLDAIVGTPLSPDDVAAGRRQFAERQLRLALCQVLDEGRIPARMEA